MTEFVEESNVVAFPVRRAAFPPTASWPQAPFDLAQVFAQGQGFDDFLETPFTSCSYNAQKNESEISIKLSSPNVDEYEFIRLKVETIIYITQYLGDHNHHSSSDKGGRLCCKYKWHTAGGIYKLTAWRTKQQSYFAVTFTGSRRA